MIENDNETKREEKVRRKNSGKTFKSRPHDKSEKRKQRKAWLKRKKDKRNQQTDYVQLNEPVAKEECHDREVVAKSGNKVNDQTLSRGRKLVELSRKRKSNEPVKAPSKVAKRVAIPLGLSDKGRKEERHRDRAQSTTGAPRFKEFNRELLAVDATETIGSGTFGKCFSAIYRREYLVVVKEIKTKDSTKKELERAKHEVIHEATVLSELGDHPGIPHLFGVCSDKAPCYLVLQQHVVEGRSVTLTKAVAEGIITDVSECVRILKQIGETLLFLHDKGYLHSDLKGNNVVLDSENHDLVLIDFGKSKRISQVRLLKPKINIQEASKRYPHIAPELHRGDRQSRASDVYSFGALIHRVLNDGKFDVPTLKSVAKKCLSVSARKRPELKHVLNEMEP